MITKVESEQEELIIYKYPIPIEEMDQTHVDASDFGIDPDKKINFPNITVLTNEQYRCLMEDGVVKMIEEGVYTDFDKEADPAFFRDRIGVINNTLAWDTSGDKSPYKCIDICTSEIYDSKCLEMDKMVAIVDAVKNGKPAPEDLLK